MKMRSSVAMMPIAFLLGLGFLEGARSVAVAEVLPTEKASPIRVNDEDLVEVPVVLLEPVPIDKDSPGLVQTASEQLPLFREIPNQDQRRMDCDRFLQNEAAHFARKLMAWAWKIVDSKSQLGSGPHVLYIALRQGGNQAYVGFRMLVGEKEKSFKQTPYIVLQLTPDRMSLTLLHETGHALHMLARQGLYRESPWSPLAHSTFASTDPVTALAEGFAIHLETLWGHYGADPDRKAYYHRSSPRFDLKGSMASEFYTPVRDLLSFSQNWARYHAVRDGTPAFLGHVYAGDYLRSQYDPARDAALLRRPNAMVASEGVVASVLFGTVVRLAREKGATAMGGLDQKPLLEAELEVIRALFDLPRADFGPLRPDVIDLVSGSDKDASRFHSYAVGRFIEVSRGVTARPLLSEKWKTLYHSALAADQKTSMSLLKDFETAREELLVSAQKRPEVLRHGLGPVIPIRVGAVKLEIKGMGESFPLEFDLNGLGESELASTPGMSTDLRGVILAELDRQPFASVADFEKRTHATIRQLGWSELSLQKSK